MSPWVPSLTKKAKKHEYMKTTIKYASDNLRIILDSTTKILHL
jgi:hypothetical protein